MHINCLCLLPMISVFLLEIYLQLDERRWQWQLSRNQTESFWHARSGWRCMLRDCASTGAGLIPFGYICQRSDWQGMKVDKLVGLNCSLQMLLASHFFFKGSKCWHEMRFIIAHEHDKCFMPLSLPAYHIALIEVQSDFSTKSVNKKSIAQKLWKVKVLSL